MINKEFQERIEQIIERNKSTINRTDDVPETLKIHRHYKAFMSSKNKSDNLKDQQIIDEDQTTKILSKDKSNNSGDQQIINKKSNLENNRINNQITQLKQKDAKIATLEQQIEYLKNQNFIQKKLSLRPIKDLQKIDKLFNKENTVDIKEQITEQGQESEHKDNGKNFLKEQVVEFLTCNKVPSTLVEYYDKNLNTLEKLESLCKSINLNVAEKLGTKEGFFKYAPNSKTEAIIKSVINSFKINPLKINILLNENSQIYTDDNSQIIYEKLFDTDDNSQIIYENLLNMTTTSHLYSHLNDFELL